MVLFHFVLACVFCASFTLFSFAKPVLLLQDEWGGITGMDITYNINEIQPFSVRPPLSNPITKTIDFEITKNGGCQLFADGSLFPVGKAHLFSGAFQNDQAVSLALLPNEIGGWIATSNYLKSIGYTPNFTQPSYHHPIRDIEYDPNRSRLIVLLNNGDAAVCTSTNFEWLTRPDLHKEETIDIEIRNGELFVLSNTGNVYRRPERAAQLAHTEWIKEITNEDRNEFIDLELLPGSGMLLLDQDGLIHSYDDAPRIPALPISVIDIEIMDTETNPFWFPQGWNTSVSFQPSVIKLDPLGPEKKVYLWMNNAENLASFSTEIHYDPTVIKLNQIALPGRWWKQNMTYPNLSTKTYPDRNGYLSIFGSGSVFPFQGANGSGELVELSLSAAEGVVSGTSVLQIQEFSFQNASPVSPRLTADTVSGATVFIAASQPKISLAWVVEDIPILDTVLHADYGELCRVDILVQEGSRIHECRFSISYSSEHIRYLGMSKGNAWLMDSAVDVLFPLPSTLSNEGNLSDITISSNEIGACQDEPGSLVSVLFHKKNSVLNGKNGVVQLDSALFTDHNQQEFVADTGNLVLYLK